MIKFNALLPELIVSNVKNSLKFYCKVIGFKIEYERQEDGFAFISYNGSQLMLEQDCYKASPWRVEPLEPPFGRGINFSIECPDVAALARDLVTSGYSLRKPIEEFWYKEGKLIQGELNFLVLDPDGYLLRFAQDLGFKPMNKDLL
ncbi:VOC family protein [Pseudomonas sp. PB120]|uniref:VOC family protein n=1 Tax=Pseudomonas sp. PB120 TaxID=2494700 RepID=UPI0012FD1D43|nr:VOC family protein [Pseudomonas sp. PB120]MVV48339.1 VOC family protein [Pseudomonas sp. PB120]